MAHSASTWEFVRENYPDHSEVAAQERITKEWVIRNNSDHPWQGYTLRFLDSANSVDLGVQPVQPVPTVAPSETVTLRLDMTMPALPGTYLSEWRLHDNQGQPLKNSLWLLVDVRADFEFRAQHIPALPAWKLGVNMREFAYYDRWVPMTEAQMKDYQRRHLKFLHERGVRLVRFYASHKDLDTAKCIARVEQALEPLQALGMEAVLCLNDSLGHSRLYVQGEDAYHSEPPSGYLHRRYWADGGYKEHFLPHVKALAKALGSHEAVRVWELGNEYASVPAPAPGDGEKFVTFMQQASEAVASHARQPISTGLLNSRQVSHQNGPAALAFAKKLYSLPTLDVVGIHYYESDQEKQYGELDIEAARELDKPFYIGELGAERRPKFTPKTRAQFLEGEIEEWKRRRAFAVLIWGFSLADSPQPYLDDRSMAKTEPDFAEMLGVIERHA